MEKKKFNIKALLEATKLAKAKINLTLVHLSEGQLLVLLATTWASG